MFLIEITYNGSIVLILCVVGVWPYILDCSREGSVFFHA